MHKRCSHEQCSEQPSPGLGGRRTAGLCEQHAEEGMRSVVHKRCSHAGCSKQPSNRFQFVRKAECAIWYSEKRMAHRTTNRCSHESWLLGYRQMSWPARESRVLCAALPAKKNNVGIGDVLPRRVFQAVIVCVGGHQERGVLSRNTPSSL